MWFNEIGKTDVGLVGGKNANLGEMYQNLTKAESKTFPGEKISVPYGFAVTAAAYAHFIKENELDAKIREALAGFGYSRHEAVGRKGRQSQAVDFRSVFSRRIWKKKLKRLLPSWAKN